MTAFPAEIPQRKLDFLRGAAALVVLFNHSRGSFYIGGERLLAGPHSLFDTAAVAILQLTSFGAEAVILFFVLSGFAMAHSIRHTSDRGRFYLKRLIRIWPPYVAAVLSALAIEAIVGPAGVRDRLLPILFYWNPSSALTPQFWSLPFEVVFYLLCPLLLATERRVRSIAAACAVLFVASVAAFGATLNASGHFLLDFTGTELFFFMVGALAYYHLDRIPAVSPRALALALIPVIAAVWLSKRAFGTTNAVSELAVIGFTLLAIRNLPDRLADNRRTNLGHFSYSLYLFHYAFLVLMAAMLGRFGIVASDIRNPFAWVLAVPIALAGSYGFYWLVEKRCNALLARMRRSPRQPRIAAASTGSGSVASRR